MVDAYKFKIACKNVDDLCHNSLNRIVEHMNKYHDYSTELGDYVKLCVTMEKLCNYCCSICCNSNISKHLLNECKLKCSLMIKCCDKINKINKTKMPKKDKDYMSCDKMTNACNALMKMCK